MLSLIALSALVAGVLAGPLAPRQDSSKTAVVDLSTSRGTPKNLASGFIYGIPDTLNQIPDHFYTDINFQYGRAGGAQLGSPSRGWIHGLSQYKGRFQSTLNNYKTCRKYGARFQLLPHDIWGTDQAGSSTVWPGDDGRWSDYEKFVKTLIDDMVANNMIEGVDWEVWNEADISVFWKGKGGVQQWIELWVRTHKLIRADPRMNRVKIAGPSFAYHPTTGNANWNNWMRRIKATNTIPDQYTYHLLGSVDDETNDPAYTNRSVAQMLNTNGLPMREINVNEYAKAPEQIPTASAWWIAGLERYDMYGLRANWQSGTVLHDLMAQLVTKRRDYRDYRATDYVAGPEWHVYRYYGSNMTANNARRVATTRSGDGWLDVYATAANDRVRLLVGNKLQTGTWYVKVDKLSAVGLPTSGSLTIDTWGFDGTNIFAPQGPPGFRNSVAHEYSGDSITFPIFQNDRHTAWAFEFNVGKSSGSTSTTTKTAGTTATTAPSTSTTTSSSTTVPTSGTCSGMWGQCGGQGWTGPTCCSSGTCTYSNDWYSQCI